ncbi:lipopolysaccharide assembly protein LapB [Pleionea sp. CnH1-48]|uniref:tetratricopeptide repeat protein n=1 Tax=Pleionea sp. CnH1-48 TaxID=2954494 RepID=UPI002097C25D|nr:tetratricopeptide repeat protein [Pleionea sp. CnH1-48]MCO7226809.1 tetratricopeptide repeat protein [Pleionea sp. CnH1-48]
MSDNSNSFINEFIHRRMPVVIASFIAGLWLSIEFTSFFVERYQLSTIWIDFVLVIGLGLLPSILLVGWNHGAPGKDSWSRFEMTFIASNLILASIAAGWGASVLQNETTSQAPEEMASSATHTTETTDTEDKDFRIQAFFLDVDSSVADSERWLAYGIPSLLEDYFYQSKTLSVRSFFTKFRNGPFNKLSALGFSDGLNVPVSLKKKITKSAGKKYMLTGKLTNEEKQLTIHLELIDVYQNNTLETITLPYESLFKTTEQVSNKLFKYFKLANSSMSIPVSEVSTLTESSYQRFVSARLKKLLDNDRDGAIKIWTSLLADKPGCLGCIQSLIQMEAENGRNDKAVEYIDQALKLSYRLGDWRILYYKAYRSLFLKDYDKAEEAFKVWIKTLPNDPLAYFEYASFLFKQKGKVEEAIQMYQSSLDIAPYLDQTILDIGLLYSFIRRSEKAREMYANYLKLHPEHEMALYYIGASYYHDAKLETAKEYFTQASLLTVNNASAYSYLSDIYLRLGNPDEAESVLHNAMALPLTDSGKSTIYKRYMVNNFHLGRYQLATENFDKKKALLEKTDVPFNVYKYTMWSHHSTLLKMKHYDKLEQLIQEFYQLVGHKNSGYGNIPYFKLLATKKELSKASELLVTIKSKFQQQTENYLDLYLLQAKEKYQEAYELYLKLKSTRPEGIPEETKELKLSHLMDTVDTFIALNKWQELRDLILENIEAFPYHPEANYYLALSYVKLGTKEQATEPLQKSLAMWKNADPEFEFKKEALALESFINEG